VEEYDTGAICTALPRIIAACCKIAATVKPTSIFSGLAVRIMLQDGLHSILPINFLLTSNAGIFTVIIAFRCKIKNTVRT
jgi:hypothetical protein